MSWVCEMLDPTDTDRVWVEFGNRYDQLQDAMEDVREERLMVDEFFLDEGDVGYAYRVRNVVTDQIVMVPR